MKKRLLEMLQEPSTYKGAAVLLGLFGVTLAPEAMATVGAGIVAAVGIWETLRRES